MFRFHEGNGKLPLACSAPSINHGYSTLRLMEARRSCLSRSMVKGVLGSRSYTKKIYHDLFPGYLSTKNGPQTTEEDLNDAQKAIIAVTGLANAHNHKLFGDIADENLFARIIRRELSTLVYLGVLNPCGILDSVRKYPRLHSARSLKPPAKRCRGS